VPRISRCWINDIKRAEPLSANAPRVWVEWVTGGVYKPLQAEQVSRVRSRDAQLPQSERQKILGMLVQFFKSHPDREYAFECCAFLYSELADPDWPDELRVETAL
jgi:hypothetical protein